MDEFHTFNRCLDNAIAGAVSKFGRQRDRLAHAAADRVIIDVQDECGGLPPGKTAELFLPFKQRSDDRSGVELGLSISRRCVEANGGKLRARDLPGKGCIFTIDLPKATA